MARARSNWWSGLLKMDCLDGKVKQCFDREENMAASNLETLETRIERRQRRNYFITSNKVFEVNSLNKLNIYFLKVISWPWNFHGTFMAKKWPNKFRMKCWYQHFEQFPENFLFFLYIEKFYKVLSTCQISGQLDHPNKNYRRGQNLPHPPWPGHANLQKPGLFALILSLWFFQ